MRGEEQHSPTFFSYLRFEDRIPAEHPLRAIRELVDAGLAELSRSFDKLYTQDGRPSIPPEQLLRALLLQPFYTVRSERQLMEQINYNLLFRWFVGLSIDDAVWDPTTFCKGKNARASLVLWARGRGP
jgi:transposase